ncbi:MAG: zinc-dependent metalloprotease [Deltaproteobacteria bacterium]|nr:zinc-dependent metalloprotease [Deltaproteobacteria bacterium]
MEECSHRSRLGQWLVPLAFIPLLISNATGCDESASSENVDFRQVRAPYVVDLPQGATICVVTNSISDDLELLSHVREGVKRWKDMSAQLGLKYRFVETEFTEDCPVGDFGGPFIIDIYSTEDSHIIPPNANVKDTLAFTGVPVNSGGIYIEPFNSIYVYPEVDGLGRDEGAHVIMHEIGHAMGFEHTGQATGAHIPNTPQSEANSIMNPALDHMAVGQFSAGDKCALVALFGGRDV